MIGDTVHRWQNGNRGGLDISPIVLAVPEFGELIGERYQFRLGIFCSGVVG